MQTAPLTEAHKEILDSIAEEPLEISTEEQIDQGLKDLGFLGQSGYLTVEQTYTDPDMAKCRYRWTRTDKPIP